MTSSPRHPPQPLPSPFEGSTGPHDLRLIAADMDGTLVGADSRLPDELWPLLARLEKRGILFVPASGRQCATLMEMFAGASDGMPFIADNGSYVLYDGEELHSSTLERETVVDAILWVRTRGRGGPILTISGKRSAYIECDDPRFLAECRKYYAKLEILTDLLDFDDEVLKLAFYHPVEVETFVRPYVARIAATHHAVVSGRHWLDVAVKGANKGYALEILKTRLGITSAQTAAFGDYLNDLEMLGAAGHSFAVSNAHPALLASARHIVPSCEERGVIRGIEWMLGSS